VAAEVAAAGGQVAVARMARTLLGITFGNLRPDTRSAPTGARYSSGDAVFPGSVTSGREARKHENTKPKCDGLGSPNSAFRVFVVRGNWPWTQPCDRGTQVSFRRVPEFVDERMRFERCVHDAALDSFATAVNETNFTMSGRVRLFYVGDDDVFHVARMERVKVDEVFDWEADKIVHRGNWRSL